MMETLYELRIEGNFLNMIKGTNEKPTASSYSGVTDFPPKIRSKTRMSTFVAQGSSQGS